MQRKRNFIVWGFLANPSSNPLTRIENEKKNLINGSKVISTCTNNFHYMQVLNSLTGNAFVGSCTKVWKKKRKNMPSYLPHFVLSWNPKQLTFFGSPGSSVGRVLDLWLEVCRFESEIGRSMWEYFYIFCSICCSCLSDET